MLIIGVLHFAIIPIFTFSGAIVSEIQKCLPEAFCCYITRFTKISQIYFVNLTPLSCIKLYLFKSELVSRYSYIVMLTEVQ